MIGTITKVFHLRKSVNGNKFKRIEFKMEDGKWRKTDICPTFHNYQNWKNLMKVGIVLEGLSLKDDETIDADSQVREYIKPIGEMSEEELFKSGILS